MEADARQGLVEHYYPQYKACDVTKRVPLLFAGDLLREIGRIFIFRCNVSWNTKGIRNVWVYFYPKNLKMSPSIPKGCDISSLNTRQ